MTKSDSNMKKHSNNTKCPLCHSKIMSKVNTISSVALKKLYKKLDNKIILNAQRDLYLCQCNTCKLSFFTPVIEVPKDFYNILQSHVWYYFEDKFEYDYVADLIKPSQSILDVGCGEAFFFNKLNSVKYIGLETGEKAWGNAQRKGAEVYNDTIEKFSETNVNAFDVVCIFQVLEHIVNVKEFLNASIKCLKKDGLLYISTPSADSFLPLIRNEILNFPPHHYSWWSIECFKKIPEIFGLELVQIVSEPMTKEFKRRFCTSVVYQAILSQLHLKFTPIDTNKFYGILWRLSAAISKFLEKGYISNNLYPNGHTVLAVYKKV